MALQHFDERLFREILDVRVTAMQRPDLDAIELRSPDRTALISARHMRKLTVSGDWEGFGDMVRQTWEDAAYEARYLKRPTPRLGMGTRGHARRKAGR